MFAAGNSTPLGHYTHLSDHSDRAIQRRGSKHRYARADTPLLMRGTRIAAISM